MNIPSGILGESARKRYNTAVTLVSPNMRNTLVIKEFKLHSKSGSLRGYSISAKLSGSEIFPLGYRPISGSCHGCAPLSLCPGQRRAEFYSRHSETLQLNQRLLDEVARDHSKISQPMPEIQESRFFEKIPAALRHYKRLHQPGPGVERRAQYHDTVPLTT